MSTDSIYSSPNPDTIACINKTITNNAQGKNSNSPEFKLLQEIQQNPNIVSIAVDRGAGNDSKVQATCEQAVKFLNKGPQYWLYQAADSLWPKVDLGPEPTSTSTQNQDGGGLNKKRTKKKYRKRKNNRKIYTNKKYKKYKKYKKSKNKGKRKNNKKNYTYKKLYL